MARPSAPEGGVATAVLLGAPVTHSRSPAMHQAAFESAGMVGRFESIHAEPEELAGVVAGLLERPEVVGGSVTVPHKQAVMALCHEVDEGAARMGAVNCICLVGAPGERRLLGHNTDAAGFVASVRLDAGRSVAGVRALVLGAGGAARAVHAGLRDGGAEMLPVVARRPERCDFAPSEPWDGATLARLLPECELLVDCTSTGLSPEREAHLPAPIPVARLPEGALVATLVYHREPALLAAARERGLATLDGAGMLVRQGALAFERWTGRPASIPAMWAAAFPTQTPGPG